jgi:hypothetical protein
MTPYFTPEWNDIPDKRSRIHPSRHPIGGRTGAGAKSSRVGVPSRNAIDKRLSLVLVSSQIVETPLFQLSFLSGKFL